MEPFGATHVYLSSEKAEYFVVKRKNRFGACIVTKDATNRNGHGQTIEAGSAAHYAVMTPCAARNCVNCPRG
jgi:hypothetical protein